MYTYTSDTPISEIFPQFLHKEAQLRILRGELHTLQDELSNILHTERNKRKHKRTETSSPSNSGPEND